MPPRSIWNGAIAFGAVNVPIKVFGAREDRQIHFHEVHLKDGAVGLHCPADASLVTDSRLEIERTFVS